MLQQGAWPLPKSGACVDGAAAAWMTLTPRLPRQIVYDFDEFMNIPPCTTGRHNADADAGGYAKSR